MILAKNKQSLFIFPLFAPLTPTYYFLTYNLTNS